MKKPLDNYDCKYIADIAQLCGVIVGLGVFFVGYIKMFVSLQPNLTI